MTNTVDFDGRRVLVTGGAGFIGSHLVDRLVGLGAVVDVVDDFSSGTESNLAAVAERITLHRIDANDADLRALLSTGGYQTLFHLAGHVDVPASVEQPRWDLEMNGLTTFSLLEAMRDAAPNAQLVFASSAAVYGEAREGQPLCEGDPTVPIAPYGVSKLMAERYLDVYASVYGLSTASVRLFPIYGPRCRKHVVFDLIRKVHADPLKLEIHGDGQQVRDFTFVADGVEAFLAVASRAPLEGEVYNVAVGAPVTIADLARAVCRASEVSPEFRYTGAVSAGVSNRWIADVAKLRALGFAPSHSLADGLSETVGWFRAQPTDPSAR